jgi:hypothetical protein
VTLEAQIVAAIVRIAAEAVDAALHGSDPRVVAERSAQVAAHRIAFEHAADAITRAKIKSIQAARR